MSTAYSPPLLRRACRVYAGLLRLTPRLRNDRGGEMLELFRDLYREAHSRGGPRGLIAFWLRTVRGLVTTALRNDQHTRRPLQSPRGDGPLRQLGHDLSHALRSLRRSPGFVATASITLALGIGATTAIFSLVHGVVIQPLPYPEPDRLLFIDHGAPGLNFDRDIGMAPALYVHYAANSKTLESIGFARTYGATLTGDAEPERITVMESTAGNLIALGVRPLHGRLLLPSDDDHEAPSVAVLTHALWNRRFAADAAIVGEDILLSGRPVSVVGILPAGFDLGDADLWLSNNWDFEANFGGFSGLSIARINSGFSLADVRRDLTARIADYDHDFDGFNPQVLLHEAGVVALPRTLKEQTVGEIELTLWVLLGTVGFLLLTACVNVANLFLVRAESRQREIAVRMALGAGRGRLIRFFLSESLVLATLGGLLGIGMATGGVRLLVKYAPVTIPRLSEVGINGVVLAFAAVVTLSAGVLFGAVPALRPMRSVAALLRDGARGATVGRGRLRGRQLLVISQVALALVLLLGAALMARSFWHLTRVDPGLDIDDLLTFQISLPSSQYPSAEEKSAFHDELIARLAALAGVESVGTTSDLPFDGLANGELLEVEGKVAGAEELPPVVWVNRASPDYFKATRIPLLAGRTLEAIDLDGGSDVVVINQAVADIFLPGEDPLGKRVSLGIGDDPHWLTIVGVVGTTIQRQLSERPEPMLFMPTTYDGHYTSNHTSFALRTTVSPSSLVDSVRRTVGELDSQLPLVRLRTMREAFEDAAAPTAFTLLLLGIAAGIALLLGSVGIYGVISYVVRQRTNEIGVRMALGARAADVRRMMLTEGAIVALLGLAAGLGGSLLLAQSMEALLYGVSPLDPSTYVAVASFLLGSVLLATWLPARRAARIDPLEALRDA